MLSNPWVDATAEYAVALTGAEDLMDGADIREVLAAAGVTFQGRVVEIGSGTGRLARLCEEYGGYDVSPEYVRLCRDLGLDVRLGKPDPGERGDWLLIAHVLCHIPPGEREEYLRLEIAPRLLTDIIPGDGRTMGHPLIYTIDPDEFEDDLKEYGWTVLSRYERPATLTRHIHRYYICSR